MEGVKKISKGNKRQHFLLIFVFFFLIEFLLSSNKLRRDLPFEEGDSSQKGFPLFYLV